MTSATQLGAALRAWRDRMTPEEAGLPVGGDRRVPGLRREELALLAGISVDYLVRLEQGRARTPSAQVLAALSRALRLSGGERQLLYRLGGSTAPSSGSLPTTIPRGVQLMIDRMVDTPLAVFTAAWDTVQRNALWTALLGDPLALDGRARNLIWRHFVTGHTASRVEWTDRHVDAFEREMVSDLRRAADRYPDDRAISELIAALREANSRFAELWDRYETVQSVPTHKTVVHPELGPITLDCDVLTIEGSDLRIVLYSASPDTRDADLLDELRGRVTSMRPSIAASR
ncbi:helix-turn-helix transcriptional regulator [Humibacter soli]